MKKLLFPLMLVLCVSFSYGVQNPNLYLSFDNADNVCQDIFILQDCINVNNTPVSSGGFINNYVKLPKGNYINLSFNRNHQNFTFSFWYNMNTTDQGYLFGGSHQTPNYERFYMRHDGSNIVLYTGSAGSAVQHTVSPTSSFLNSWGMITIAYKVVGSNDYNYTLYFNGSYMSSWSDVADLFEQDWILGGFVQDNVITLDKDNSFDEFALYDTLLTSEEIYSLYTNYSAGYTPTLLVFSTCAEEDEGRYIQLDVYDEQTQFIAYANITGYIDFVSNEENYTKILSSNNVNNVSICTTKVVSDVMINSYIVYTGQGGVTERYYIINSSVNLTDVNYINLYTFDDSSGLSTLESTIYDYFVAPAEDVIAKLQRYYPANNTWITVQIDKADEFGKTIHYVYQNSVDYKFVFEDSEGILMVTKPLKFICDSATTCEESFSLPAVSTSDRYNGMSYVTTWDNSSKIYTLTYSDTNNVVQTVSLIATVMKPYGKLEICNVNSTTTSGTLVCNVSGYTGTITFNSYRHASPWEAFNVLSVILDAFGLGNVGANFDVQRNGMLFSVLFFSCLAGFGAFSPVVGVITIIVGFLIMVLLNLTSVFNIGSFVLITFLGLFTAFVLEKKKNG